MNTRNSITSQDEKLVNMKLNDQWENINWNEAKLEWYAVKVA